MKYIKPLKSTFAPRRIAAVAVNLCDAAAGGSASSSRLVFDEGAIAFGSKRARKWKVRDPAPRLGTDELWSDFVDCLAPRSQTYVVAENVSDWMTAGRVYDRLDSGEADLPGLRFDGIDEPIGSARKGRTKRACLIVGGATEIVRLRVGDCWAVIVGIGNYVGRSVESVYKDAAARIGGDWPRRVELGLHRTDAAMRASLLLQWATGAADWWRAIDGGPWRETAANLAQSLFRKRHLTAKILKDDHELQHRISRAGLFGGRASQWFYGRVGFSRDDSGDERDGAGPDVYPRHPGPIFHLDCRSLYASLLRDERFPVRLDKCDTRATVASLARMLRTRGAIANVELNSPVAEYPYRRSVGRTRDTKEERDAKRRAGDSWRERTDYPTGRFWTTLAGPELAAALREKIVLNVHGAAYYHMDRAFRSFAMELLDRRRTARQAGDAVGEGFAKLLINAFAGKFAQRGGGWSIAPEVEPPEPWAEWSQIDASTGIITRFRSLSSVVQRHVKDDGSPRGIPQIFAYLTSYGRSHMRRLRELCPARSVVSQDTDSLWVTSAGLDALRSASMIRDDEPGFLRVLGRFDSYLGWSPRHYCADGHWTLAGLKAGWTHVAGGGYRDEQRFPYAGLSSNGGAPSAILTVRRHVLLTNSMSGDPIESDGWSRPLQFGRGSNTDTGHESDGTSPPRLFPPADERASSSRRK